MLNKNRIWNEQLIEKQKSIYRSFILKEWNAKWSKHYNIWNSENIGKFLADTVIL